MSDQMSDQRIPIVRAEKVWKSFGATPVLRDVSFELWPHQVLCVMGPSGSGKSTLLRCINHLERVDAGRIWIDGQLIGYHEKGGRLHELREREVCKRRAEIGMVFQHFNLFPHMTALSNVAYAPIKVKRLEADRARELARALLTRVGLAEKVDSYPRHLSGGQQQRVAIARALAMTPKLILFDEPTSALDPELVKEVLDVIRDLARDGISMIVVTHEVGFAREAADVIAFMDQGVLVESGSPQEMLDRPTHDRTREFLSRVL
jgi:polar amino acid transport system ATP-binding protein